MSAALLDIVALNRAGSHAGIPSYCTAHRQTLQAILRFHRDRDDPVLIEATCNQVNQDGGYTGMVPAAFRDFVHGLARDAGLDRDRLILGGDHLGPNPWKALPAVEAMANACALVQAYVEAGFTKIHLDASMACADDAVLSEQTIAARAAAMARVAEDHAHGGELLYVVGTEVPKPGGETVHRGGLSVTAPEAARTTHHWHREAFRRVGLEQAFERVIGIVVQPGVDFGNSQVFAYDRHAASTLSEAVTAIPGAVFEAHSTDYQSASSLRDLVASHFAILKVGPELTAAYREAVVAMASIESWLPVARKSGVLDIIERTMLSAPGYWRDYVMDGPGARMERLFGLSDRIRYYWPDDAIQSALKMLCATIDASEGEAGLLAQFAGLPAHEAPDLGVDAGLPLSTRIIQARVGAVAAKYVSAC